jgi:hypothetical protein
MECREFQMYKGIYAVIEWNEMKFVFINVCFFHWLIIMH